MLRQIQLPRIWSGQLIQWLRQPHIAQAATSQWRPGANHRNPAGTMVARGFVLHHIESEGSRTARISIEACPCQVHPEQRHESS
jgi:hypothetical protein